FFERWNAAENDRINEHQIPSIARFDRPLPRARLKPLDRNRKLRSELFDQLLGWAISVVILEHERIAKRSGDLRVLGLIGDFGQRLQRVFMRALTAAVGRKVEMPEAE